MKPLPYKTDLDVKFSQNFCYDNDLAQIYFNDFMEEAPIIKILNSRYEITALVIFANEDAKYEKHYSEEQLKDFKNNPRELIAEKASVPMAIHKAIASMFTFTMKRRKKNSLA